MKTAPPADGLERAAAILRCVGHPVRLRILAALDRTELSVTELQDQVGEDQATVSRQLAVMRARKLVGSRRDGVNVYYRVTEPRVHGLLGCVLTGVEIG